MRVQRMRTSLVYPGIAGYGFGSLGKGMEAGWVSHGLAHLSSAAKAKGHQIDLIDLRALSGWDEFREELLGRRPDVLALTMMSVDFNPATEAARVIKEVLPASITVVRRLRRHVRRVRGRTRPTTSMRDDICHCRRVTRPQERTQDPTERGKTRKHPPKPHHFSVVIA